MAEDRGFCQAPLELLESFMADVVKLKRDIVLCEL